VKGDHVQSDVDAACEHEELNGVKCEAVGGGEVGGEVGGEGEEERRRRRRTISGCERDTDAIGGDTDAIGGDTDAIGGDTDALTL
jgi:hypothetical protein